MKLKIINKKVFIDDKEILNVSKLIIHKELNMPDKITLEFYVDEVEENSEEKADKNGIELVINGAIVNKNLDSEDLVKAIMKNFNKSSYR